MRLNLNVPVSLHLADVFWQTFVHSVSKHVTGCHGGHRHGFTSLLCVCNLHTHFLRRLAGQRSYNLHFLVVIVVVRTIWDLWNSVLLSVLVVDALVLHKLHHLLHGFTTFAQFLLKVGNILGGIVLFLDTGIDLHCHGTKPEIQRTCCLLLVLVTRTNGQYDSTLGGSSQTVAKQTGQLGVTVWHVLLLVCETVHDGTQCQQRRIDLLSLFGGNTGGNTGQSETFVSCQVHKYQLSDLGGHRGVIRLHTYVTHQGSVPSRTGRVHKRCAGHTMTFTKVEQLHKFTGGGNELGGKPGHFHTFRIGGDVQLRCFRGEQVLQLVQINLYHAEADLELVGGLLLGPGEDVVSCTRDDTSFITFRSFVVALHCVCFPRASLTVGHNGTTITLEHVLQGRQGGIPENVLLLAVVTENLVVTILLAVCILNDAAVGVWRLGRRSQDMLVFALGKPFSFVLVWRTHTQDDSDTRIRNVGHRK
mmetsp:Transcript_2602/g.4861  ORF Transcript_2602/g.4861 Transcript_2602/m.4861 type:complete len:474 (-) Transcript_2602:15-1436(-)